MFKIGKLAIETLQKFGFFRSEKERFDTRALDERNREALDLAIRKKFQIVSQSPEHIFMARTHWKGAGENTKKMGERDLPQSKLHGVESILVTAPHDVFDDLEVPEIDHKSDGRFDELLNTLLGPMKKTVMICTIEDFNGASIDITFPVTVKRGKTPDEQMMFDEIAKDHKLVM